MQEQLVTLAALERLAEVGVLATKECKVLQVHLDPQVQVVTEPLELLAQEVQLDQLEQLGYLEERALQVQRELLVLQGQVDHLDYQV